MRVLLDTHTLLWFYGGNEQLSSELRQLIRNPVNDCYVSVASLWEITIKLSLGKLTIDTPVTDLFNFLERNQIWVIPVELSHLLQLQQLPHYHKDPFDRLIIAQAVSENLAVATRASFFSQYGLTITW
jgi:PIN domain nuclease of toxin-antitoxin system